jgi:hypothetical protein
MEVIQKIFFQAINIISFKEHRSILFLNREREGGLEFELSSSESSVLIFQYGACLTHHY